MRNKKKNETSMDFFIRCEEQYIAEDAYLVRSAKYFYSLIKKRHKLQPRSRLIKNLIEPLTEFIEFEHEMVKCRTKHLKKLYKIREKGLQWLI
jgi:hypothetical protein